MPRVYIAGPMRGLPASNFPAFDRATRLGRANGWDVVNPADMDRAEGVSGDNPGPIGPRECRVFASRDINAILSFRAEDGDAIALLPGWSRSTGAMAEVHVAKWVGLRILSALDFEDLVPRIEAHEATIVPAEFQNGGCGPNGCLTTGSDGLQESVTLADQQRVREYLEYGPSQGKRGVRAPGVPEGYEPLVAAAQAGLTEGWTGERCPKCKGVGEIDGSHYTRTCPACAGTGDEYSFVPPIKKAEPAPVATLEFGSCESGVCGLSKDLETAAMIQVAERMSNDPTL